MVRYYIAVLILIFSILSCNREINRDGRDIWFSYANFSNSASFLFIKQYSVEQCDDSFNISNFNEYGDERLLCKQATDYLNRKIWNMWKMDTLKLLGSSDVSYKYCKSIEIRKGIVSHLILMNHSNLLLLNEKNNYLKSLAFVSEYSVQHSKIVDEKTYFDKKNYSFLLLSNAHKYGIDPYSRIDDFWSRIGLLKCKTVKYYYASFTIDENGFVKFVPFDEEKFHEYLK